MDLQVYERKLIKFTDIDLDPHQPRQTIRPETIAELADSIKEHGLIEDIIVKPNLKKPGRYILVAGERRFRALKLMGLQEFEFKVFTKDPNTYKMSLVENLHREDMNPIDEALAYKHLREVEKMTFPDMQELTKKSISTMINKIKLLELPEEIQNMVKEGTLPQQGALNLSQYKGEIGNQIRMAYDLIAGKNPLGLGGRRNIIRSQVSDNMIKGHLPGDCAGLLSKMIDFGYKAKAVPFTIEKFCSMSKEEQKLAIHALNPKLRKNLRESLYKSATASLKFIDEALDPAIREDKGRYWEDMSEFRAKLKKDRATASVPSNGHKEKEDKRKEYLPAPLPPPPVPEYRDTAQSVLLSRDILKNILYSNANSREPDIDFSLKNLSLKINWHVSNEELEKAVIHSFRAMERRWRMPTFQGDTDEKAFRQFISRVRNDFRCGIYQDFLHVMRKTRPMELDNKQYLDMQLV